MARARAVLHATDFSRTSAAAFRAAVAWARRTGSPLVLAHVVLPPGFALEDSYQATQTLRDLAAMAHRDAQKRLDRLVRRARAAGVRVRTVVLDGLPPEQIVRAARRERAGLIVLGTHGRTGFRRLMLGSVAARVLAQARCPVLTVRGATT